MVNNETPGTASAAGKQPARARVRVKATKESTVPCHSRSNACLLQVRFTAITVEDNTRADKAQQRQVGHGRLHAWR